MVKLFIILILGIYLSGCSANFFKEFADRNSDDALIFDAQTAVNTQAYDEAINIITQRLSSSGQQKTEAREILSSAYAGKCGLNFIEYVDGLANSTTGTAFELASNPFVGVEVAPEYCLLSLQTLDLIGNKAERTINQNAFASVVGMVLMGSATRLYTDDNPTLGDGTPDAVGISCTLTDAQIDNIVLGYAYMASNFSALGDQIGASSGASFQDSIDACTSLAGSSCEITDPALITIEIRATMKNLLNTQQYGIGSFNASTPLLIPAACL